jgi:tRNA pseudouridine32 synthase / 23S rRNA pseudouridine746 synthase
LLITERVLAIDGEAIVLDKPAGLPVDRPRDGTVSLADMLGGLRFGFSRPPAPVHRLDRDTSGCLLLARNPKAHARFARSWEQGLVRKTYLAVLAGSLEAEEGVIDLPLAKHSTASAGWRMIVDPSGRPARTRWRRLGEAAEGTLVRFEPETGRTHQIRVHAAEGLGCAIVGDPVYGKAGPAMLLHAWRLAVPRHEKPAIEAEAPPPGVLGRVLADLSVRP